MNPKKIEQKSNELILHQNTARLRGNLTPVQSRSMLAILKRANDEVTLNPNIKDFTIPTKVFLDDIQDKDNSSIKMIINKLDKHLKLLMTKTFEWGTEKEKNICVFIQQIKITEDTVTFKFSDYIREHIKPLSNFLIIRDFELLQSFRSEYSRQLYKHLMMWEKRGTLELSIKDFKEYLGVPSTSAYDRFDNVKRKVLNVAIAEINEKRPDMQLMAINKKEGKSVVAIAFAWFFRKDKETGLFSGEELKSEFIDYIGKFIDGGKAKVLTITPFDNPQRYRVDTPLGEYTFPNIELLRKEIEDNN
jgi:plasmid replication initiation protein